MMRWIDGLADARLGRWVGWGCALMGAVAFSGKAILAKLMYRHGVDANTVLFWRMAVALPFFLGMAYWAGRGQVSLKWPALRQLMWLGFVGYYLASYLDFLGLTLISANLERLILYLNPTMVLLIGLVAYRKRVSPRQLWAMAISYLGVVLAFAHELHIEGEGALWGSLCVLGSALSYAFYLSGSGQWAQRLGTMRLVGWASSVACVLCLVQGWWVHGRDGLIATPTPVLAWSLLNGVACTVIPTLLVMVGVKRLGAATAAQVGMVGPMSTIGMSAWVLGEPFTLMMGLGTVLVVAGVAVLAAGRRESS